MIANNIGVFMITERLLVCGVIWCNLSVCREVGVFIYHRLDLNKDCIVAYGVGVLQDCVDSVLVKMLCGRVRREIFSVKKTLFFMYS